MQADSLIAAPAGHAVPSDALLAARGLGCARNEFTVFRDLAFSLPAGQILLIEGENGSGKTTLLRVLCGLLEAEAGEVLWRGEDIRMSPGRYRRNLCYIGHGNGIKLGLTARENLAVLRDLSAAPRGRELTGLLQRFGLAALADVPAQYLSAGQRRRLALARLLLEQRPLWILDEPFTSLDTDGRRLLRDLFREQLAAGGAVIMTSHDPFAPEEMSLQRLILG